jgi:hypothetical protein
MNTNQKTNAPAVVCDAFVRAVRVSDKLIETRDGIKRLLAEKWPEKLREIRPVIEWLMTRQGSDNALEVVLPIAKEMSADGHSPAMLLAVACEMVQPSCPNNRIIHIEK